MKKNKGFTLIELLSVIVILGVILSISVFAVSKIKNKQDEENKLNIVSSIMTGTKNYIAEHPEFWNSKDNCDYAASDNCPDSSNKYIGMDKIIEYADFDINKYPDLYYENKEDADLTRNVMIKACESDNIKYEIHFYYNNNYYTDCGCEEQQLSTDSFYFCDANNSGHGWDISGKYH